MAVGHPLNMCHLIVELVNNVYSVGWMEKDLHVSVRGSSIFPRQNREGKEESLQTDILSSCFLGRHTLIVSQSVL